MLEGFFYELIKLDISYSPGASTDARNFAAFTAPAAKTLSLIHI